MATDVQVGHCCGAGLALMLDGRRRADRETPMAKLVSSEVALRPSLTAMRVHGEGCAKLGARR